MYLQFEIKLNGLFSDLNLTDAANAGGGDVLVVAVGESRKEKLV